MGDKVVVQNAVYDCKDDLEAEQDDGTVDQCVSSFRVEAFTLCTRGSHSR